MLLCVSDAFLALDTSHVAPLHAVLTASVAQSVHDPLGRVACWRLESLSSEDMSRLKAWARTLGVSIAFFERLPKWSDFSVLMTDMDHTLIDADVLKELAVFADQEEAYKAILATLSNGMLSFEASLKERATLLKGLPEDRIQKVVSGLTFNPGIVALLDEARQQGLRTYVLSSGIDDIAQPLSEMLSMTGAIANHLDIRNGRLTADIKGPLGGPLLDAAGKCSQMTRISKALSTKGPDSAFCCGDSGNDALMLKAAGMGVSFYGSSSAVEAANVNINSGGFEWILDLLKLHERLAVE